MGSLFASGKAPTTNALGRAAFDQKHVGGTVGPSLPPVAPAARAPSLVEQHQRRLAAERAQAATSNPAPTAGGDWEWRSWDRDRDLGAGREAPDQVTRLRGEAELGDRFGRGRP